MSNLMNALLILVMFISVWPSLVYVVGQVTIPVRPSSVLRGIQLGRGVVGSSELFVSIFSGKKLKLF
jgi:hypothetical protein